MKKLMMMLSMAGILFGISVQAQSEEATVVVLKEILGASDYDLKKTQEYNGDWYKRDNNSIFGKKKKEAERQRRIEDERRKREYERRKYEEQCRQRDYEKQRRIEEQRKRAYEKRKYETQRKRAYDKRKYDNKRRDNNERRNNRCEPRYNN